MKGRGKLSFVGVLGALAVLLAACGASGTAEPIPAGVTPACPYVMDWPPYDGVGVPAGITVPRIALTTERVSNATSQGWTVEGHWFEWLPCMGITLSRGDPVALPAGSATDVTIQDPGWNMEPSLPAPTRIGIAFWDHACTLETCGDPDNPPGGFWWVEIPTPTPGPVPT